MSTDASGRITTPEGRPVAGARVTVIDSTGAAVCNAVVGRDGRFELHGLVPGPITLLATAEGHEPLARAMSVPPSHWIIGTLLLTPRPTASRPPAGRWIIDPAHSFVLAQTRHLGLATVRGAFDRFSGVLHVDDDFELSSCQAVIDASSIDTGNEQRDDHLRSVDFLDVRRYPELRYSSSRVARIDDGWAVDGMLTMIGSTRPVLLDVVYHGHGPDPWGGTRAGFSATGTLHRSDFDMNWNLVYDIGLDAIGTALSVEIEIEALLQE